jgi:hypothetical protein
LVFKRNQAAISILKEVFAMNETDYNARLYEKMKAEQDKYRDRLLHPYEYTMRVDIVMEEASVCGNVTIYGGEVSNSTCLFALDMILMVC